MSTPDYIKRAQKQYNSKFDLIQLRLPKGTKDKIKAITKDSIAGYCVKCILGTIENTVGFPDPGAQESADLEPTKDERKNVASETRKKEYREITPEENAEFLRIVGEKKAEQDRKSTETQKEKEERQRQEKQERQSEYLTIAERIRNGEGIQEDVEKERVRRESIARAQNPY